jgi:hypothetical protein
MIDLVAARRGLAGAWRLAQLDPAGMRLFDTSIDGFWRSFQAALIAAPPFLLLVVLRAGEHPLSDDPIRAFLIEIIGYVIGWTAYPLAAWYLASALNQAGRYTGYIVAHNWGQVLQIALFVPVAALSAAEIFPGYVSILLALIATGAVIYYQYFIVRTALGIDALPAIGFVTLDLMIGLLLDAIETTLQLR